MLTGTFERATPLNQPEYKYPSADNARCDEYGGVNPSVETVQLTP
jgi:hypothetical protein